MLRIFNTLTRKIEPFEPLHPPMVTYYSCGPTVYDYAHIGHARTFIFADVLQRVLEFNAFKVKRVMNITDVGHLTSDADEGEDKMEKGAAREGKSVWDIAKFYTDDFFDMLQKLNIKKPEHIPRATEYIKEMIQIVEMLENKGLTYNTQDGVYFDTSKFPQYGKLTGKTIDELTKGLKAGARIEVIAGKKNPTDFALWKFSYPNGRSFDVAMDDVTKQRQMEWNSPWGKGFPGWHIECSAMSMNILSETIDIHTGGVDHIPIHHTNEIAQSEAATGKQFVRHWLHGEHLLIDGKKMSKSLGNFYRLEDIEEKGFSPLALRYLFLTANYRTQMNFTWKSLEGAQQALDGLIEQISNFKFQISSKDKKELSGEKSEEVNHYREKFIQAINDDLNTAQAIAVLWDVIKNNISPHNKYDLLCLFYSVLGLDLDRKLTDTSQKITIPEEILVLSKKREQLRKEKKWDEADQIRKQIEEEGYTVEDASSGPIVTSTKHL